MYCKNCGNPIPEGNRFCEICGTAVPEPGPSGKKILRDNKKRSAPLDPKQQKKRIAIIAAIVVIIGGGIGILTGYLTQNSNAEYQEKLTTAQQYIDDGKVDEAIETFEEAIEIKPKKEEAYLQLADLYITHERYYDAVRTLKLGFDNTGNKEAFQKPIEKAESDLDGSWKSAYRKVLEDNQIGILNYQDREYEHVEGTTALCDLNDDGIPELLFFAGEHDGLHYDLNMYTFVQGEAKKIDYSYKNAIPNMEDGTPFRDLMAASGTSYLIFRQKSVPGFVIYSTISDESIFASLTLYDMDKKGELTEKDCVGYSFDYYNEDHSTYYEEIDFDRAKYYRSNGSIEKDDYDKVYDQVLKGMGDVIFYRHLGEDTDDAKALWEKGGSSQALSMSYEDMIEKLKVNKPDKPASDSGGDNELFKEISGKPFAFSSGAGAWGTNIEFEPDGSFHGQYGDSNMGMTGEGYPNGERLFSEFSGKFKDPQKTGDKEYTITLDGDVKLENTVGDSEIIDGVLYKYSEPYGIENLKDGDKLTLTLPGHDAAVLKEYVSWFTMAEWYEEGMSTCPVYLLLNPEMKYAFVMMD